MAAKCSVRANGESDVEGGTGSFFRERVPRSLVVLGLVVLLELLLELVPLRVRDVRAREREGDAAEDEGSMIEVSQVGTFGANQFEESLLSSMGRFQVDSTDWRAGTDDANAEEADGADG